MIKRITDFGIEQLRNYESQDLLDELIKRKFLERVDITRDGFQKIANREIFMGKKNTESQEQEVA